MAKSFFENLLGGVKDLTGGQGASDLAGKAKTAWGNQSTLTKGAIAGGLLGVLLSGNARRLVGTGVKVGGAALIGVSLWSSIRWNRVFGREDAQTGPDSLHDAAANTMPADQLGQQSRA